MSDDSLSNAELRSAALRGLRINAISRPTLEFVSMGTLIVLARLIPPAEFGRYAVAVIAGEFMFVPTQAVGTALVQRPNSGPEYLQTGVALSLLIGVVIVGMTLVAATVLVAPIFGERTAYLVRLTTLGCIMGSTNMVPGAVLQRRLAFRRLSAVQVAVTVVSAAASICLAVLGLGGAALVLGGLVGGIAGTVLLWSWAPPPLPRLHLAPARDIATYGVPAGLSAVGWVGFRNCDYAIVGARLGALQAGLYFRAYTLGVEYQKKISQVTQSVGFPLLARTQSLSGQHELRGRMVRLMTLVLFPALVLLAITAPLLIPLVFGDQWKPAVSPTQILAAGGAVTLVIDAVGAQLMAAGRARAMVGYGWGHFGVYALAVFVISPLGITAVAVAATAVHTLFLIVAYILVVQGNGEGSLQQLRSALTHLLTDVMPATVSCAALAMVAIPLTIAMSTAQVSAVPSLAVVSVAGATAYLGVLKILYPESFRSLWNLVCHLTPQRPLRRLARRPALAGTRPAA